MKISYIKSILVVCILALSSSITHVFWFFEDRLLCEVQDNQVQVSIDTQAQGRMNTYCFTILQRLAQKISTLEADQVRASNYVTQWSVSDRKYRNQVLITLESSLVPYRTLRELITSTMRDYENELFFSVKNLVKTYLRDEYEMINLRLDQANTLKSRIVSLWNNQQFEFIQERIQQRETERMVLFAIRNASSFDTLIPALRNYFWIQQSQISSL